MYESGIGKYRRKLGLREEKNESCLDKMREDKGKVQKKRSKRKMHKTSRGRSGRKKKQKTKIKGQEKLHVSSLVLITLGRGFNVSNLKRKQN